MDYNFKLISKTLEKKGYFVIRNFLDKSDIDQSMISYLKKKIICLWCYSWDR